MATIISNTARSAAADAIVDLVDGGDSAGTLTIYSGTRPAGPDTDVTDQTALATITLNSTAAFGDASNGVATLAGTPLSTTGLAAGTATWFRVADSDGTAIFDGDVGTSGKELTINTTTISVGLTVEVTSGTLTMPSGAS